MLFLTVLINMFVVSVCVLLHYEMLLLLSKSLQNLSIKARYKLVFGVFGALTAHAIEVWLFAMAYYFMIQAGHFGQLEGNFNGSLLDSVYFSFTSFTTLGFGDIVPLGLIRFLVGLESLAGLVLITWSASFLFYEMQKNWNIND